jgi:hypothetical protein
MGPSIAGVRYQVLPRFFPVTNFPLANSQNWEERMRGKILAGAIAALFVGGVAFAGEAQDQQAQDQQAQDQQGTGGASDLSTSDDAMTDDSLMVPDVGASQEGIGGSGNAGTAKPNTDMKQGHMQHGQGMQHGKGMTLHCTPVDESATGGAGLEGTQPLDEQSSVLRDFDSEYDVDSKLYGEDEAFGGSGLEPEKEKKGADMRGLTVLIGGGVEGYTGDLAGWVDPGATVGVTAAIKPSKVFGLELGYSGAANNFDADVGGSGPDIIRHGAQAALTFGLAATDVQPYVLGGVGLNRYNIRNGGATGFGDDVVGNVPVGLGLRTHFGDFTADARVNYNFMLSDEFSPTTTDGGLDTGRYTGTINLGGTF